MKHPRISFTLACWFAATLMAQAQGTAFTYQGRLDSGGGPVNGSYDLTFSLFSTNTDGSPLAGPLTNSAIVASNGLFGTTLDFGTNFSGADRWLEIGVRSNGGGGSFAILSPRQKLTPAPYAIFAGTAGNLNGPLSAAQLAGNYFSAVAFTNSANSFGGNGGALSNVNAATLNGLAATNFWQTGGNLGTSPASNNFVGTRDNQPLEFRVNGARALRLEPGAFPNVVGGASNNSAGGASGAFIGGGTSNTIQGQAFVGVIGGGLNNTIASNTAFATIPGGVSNVVSGNYSFAAGLQAQATNQGAFVWADSQGTPFASTKSNQFNIRASGGVRLVTGGAGGTIDGLPILLGNGAGALAWLTVTGTVFQAQPRYGYILTNSQPVAVMLPTNAVIGDVTRVSGGGAGGWKITQTSGQSILAGNFTLISRSPLTWTPTVAGNRNWRALASSADGSKLTALEQNGQIYISATAGGSWSPATAPFANWFAVAASADGTKQVAVIYGGQIYTSVNSGGSWTAGNVPASNWTAVAASADGSKLVAGILNGPIYTSTNSGASWTPRSAYTGYWQSLASSADGTKLVGGIQNGAIYTSLDSGVTWTATSAGSANWVSVASSADGSRLAAVAASGGISVSANAGLTWTIASAPVANWSGIASSADGGKLVAGVLGGFLYTSTDFGATWMTNNAPGTNWSAVASSADGGKLAAAVANGSVYTSSATTQQTTTSGTTGYLSGGQNTAVELQYIGNGQFMPLSHEGNIFAY